jgi:NTP pyrophosphatase (non-canonical NTP hydrolase)
MNFQMIDFTINEMREMQVVLQEKYKDKWEGISPEVGQNKLLWMIGEIGEVIDVIKKNGSQEAVENPQHRKDLVEELADVLMYYNDVLLCYGISAEELKNAYTSKFQRNMTRW